MSSRLRVPLVILRLKNFLVLLLRNKMALIGLVLLVSFSFLALGAPFLTPYDPLGDVVSAPLNQPDWIPFLRGPVGFSRNTEFTNIEGIPNQVSVTTATTGTDGIDVQIGSNPSGGSLLVRKTLAWGFQGPAARFSAKVSLIAPQEVTSVPGATATLFIDRLTASGTREEGAHWVLWNNATLIAGDNSPPYPLDSASYFLNQLIRTPGNSAASVIFSKIADYTFGLEISLPAGLSGISLSVKDYGLQVYGNTWGKLGTDYGGHDIFTQLVYGAQLSLFVGLVATLIGVGLGLIVGLLAGYLGKLVDEVLMRFTDMMLVIPGLPLLIVLASTIGSGLTNIIIILGFLGWMGFARLVRSQVLSLRERPFIEAAKASGAGTGYTLIRHVFPNVVSLTYVNLALSVPAAIVGEAALSFLGLGDTNVVTWGRMLALSREAGGTAGNLYWWWVIPPGIAIALISLSFILIGYSLDEIFNPKLRKRR